MERGGLKLEMQRISGFFKGLFFRGYRQLMRGIYYSRYLVIRLQAVMEICMAVCGTKK